MQKEKGTRTADQLSGVNNYEIDCYDRAKVNVKWNRKDGCHGGMNMSSLMFSHQHGFNDEELLWLNRIAFALFSEYGSHLKFN